MKKFIVFGYTNLDLHNEHDEPTQEDRMKIFAKWGEWQKDMGEFLISMGSPLINGVQINQDGFKEEKVSNLSGYMIIQGENKEHAFELLKKSPLFGMGHGQNYELFECIM
jgi:hypothetical protein